MTHPIMLANRIKSLLSKKQFDLTSEPACHAAILSVLQAEGFEPATEVRLGDKCRIDLMVGAVGIEIKVGRQHQRRSVFDQLHRYAAFEQVQALVLATGYPWPASVNAIAKKPLFVVDLSRGWL